MSDIRKQQKLICKHEVIHESLPCDNSENTLVSGSKPKQTTSKPARRLSFSLEGDDEATTPLYNKIGEKCLVTLAEILFDLILRDSLFAPMFSNSKFPMNPNMFYHFILHITARKPYDVDKMRKGHGKIGFEEKHFHQLILLLGKAMGMMGVKEDVMREVLQAAMTTKNVPNRGHNTR
jgi:truncated hemoglobin YjbI